MQSILTVIFCCVCYEVTAQAANKVPTTPVSPPKSNWEEFTTSHEAFKESTKSKRDKFSCALNLLKNALTEELKKSYYLNDNTAQDNVSSINRITEEKQFIENNENQIEKPIMRDDNLMVKNENQKVVMKTTSEFSNNTNEQKNIETPTMIPIFKPRPRPVSEFNHNLADFSYTTRQGPTSEAVAFVPEKIIQTIMSPISSQTESKQNIAFSSTPYTDNRQTQKSRAASFVPEKLTQTNMSPVPNQAMFNIPCQRAADVLDMSVMFPKDAASRNTNVSPMADNTKLIYPNQIPAPINCADEDDTVAMLFKPKNISLKQVYGNLLKKITITVLVPYHMSKLGRKQIS